MQPKRIFDLLEIYQDKFPGKVSMSSKVDGKWTDVTIEQYIYHSNIVSSAFLEIGLQKGDKIATILNNRPEWNFIDMACAQTGLVHVPIYPTISEADLEYIFKHSQAKTLILSGKDYYSKLSSIISRCEHIENVYTFENIVDVDFFGNLEEIGRTNLVKNIAKINYLKQDAEPDDLLSLIYTSGTTGKPKGAMITHRNLLSDAIEVAKLHHLDSKHNILSFLPLSHIYERMFHYLYLILGIKIYYAESLNTIGDNLKELGVNGFLTVPRLLEKIFDRFMSAGNELHGLKRMIFMWAVNLGFKYKLGRNSWFYRLKLKLANYLVFKKLREALGNNISFIGCGGAALQSRLERIFHAAEIPVYVGYGLTETSPVVSVNFGKYPNIKHDTVGRPIGNCNVKIDVKGEILVKGPNVISAYYNDDELNRTSFNSHGWFRTGDKGIIRDDGFLVITGRIKEIFKTSGAKYIAPEKIENYLKESMFIENAMVVGENKRFPAAFIVPNFIYLHDWCNLHNIKFRDNNKLIEMPKVIDRFTKEIDRCNKHLGQSEKIKVFRILPDEWNTQTGELTPTLKLRRNFILYKNLELFNEIYDS